MLKSLWVEGIVEEKCLFLKWPHTHQHQMDTKRVAALARFDWHAHDGVARWKINWTEMVDS